MAEDSGGITEQAGQATQAAPAAFKYGKCVSDHKDGKALRTQFRTIDYMKDEPYAGQVRDMLEHLGLPQPKDHEIFRGTFHDLLFLDSHGVVLRIGPTDVKDLMNPGIIQPLGWLNSQDLKLHHGKEVPLSVTMYPGIELYKHFLEQDDRPEVVGNLDLLFWETGQSDSDLHEDNIGIIRLEDENGREVAVRMLLDPDNRFNSSHGDKSNKKAELYKDEQKKGRGKGEAMEATLSEVFKEAKNIGLYKRAFQLHQPLRNMFWRAFKDTDHTGGEVDQELRDTLWQTMAEATGKTKTMSYEAQTAKKSGLKTLLSGVQACSEMVTVKCRLETPWTPEAKEKIQKAVQDKHRKTIKKKPESNYMKNEDPEKSQSRYAEQNGAENAGNNPRKPRLVSHIKNFLGR
ncbi:MAG: hypothetical protein EA357_02640 [Micavibrio sp.]|nr:MAG: hypothetical protein EA357_02640 [Micavibrio sp.]